MKSLGSKEMYKSICERYDLDGVVSTSEDNKGLVICYALASCIEIELTLVDLEAAHEEIGVPLAWHRRTDKETFFKVNKTLERFLKIYDDDDFGFWEVEAMYQGTEISISGNREDTDIGVSYPKEHPIDIAYLFEKVEAMTIEWAFNK